MKKNVPLQEEVLCKVVEVGGGATAKGALLAAQIAGNRPSLEWRLRAARAGRLSRLRGADAPVGPKASPLEKVLLVEARPHRFLSPNLVKSDFFPAGGARFRRAPPESPLPVRLSPAAGCAWVVSCNRRRRVSLAKTRHLPLRVLKYIRRSADDPVRT